MRKSGRTFFRELMEERIPRGTFVSCTDPTVVEILASAGFDFVIIDQEHGPIDTTITLQHIRAAEGKGILPLARVIDNARPLIQAALDLGAQGVVVPKVESMSDVERAFAASMYAPKGSRGMCPACHAGGYSLKHWHDHVDRSNDNILIIPLIETRRAVENIAEIVAVDGVDFFLFGAGDMAADMGLRLGENIDLLAQQWYIVRDAVHAAGKYIIAGDGPSLNTGSDIRYTSMDLLILLQAAERIIQSEFS